MKKFYQCNRERNYSESTQTSSILFSFCKKVSIDNEDRYEELHPRIRCREILTGLVFWAIANKSRESNFRGKVGYGLVIGDWIEEVETDRTIMALYISDDEKENLIRSMKYIRYLERLAGIDKKNRSKLIIPDSMYRYDNSLNVIILEGNGLWMKSPLLNNILTGLLRAFTHGENRTYSLDKAINNITSNLDNNDSSFLSFFKSELFNYKKFFSNIDDVFCGDYLFGIDKNVTDLRLKKIMRGESISFNISEGGIIRMSNSLILGYTGFNTFNWYLSEIYRGRLRHIKYYPFTRWAINYLNLKE